ncbi:MAG: YggS family pyridoxal phosphate-dependent enzyme [Candidatus Omnitrophota bacterium]|jgi:hypothetical protein
MQMIKEKLDSLRTAIAQICERCGRKPDEIVLVGVTKFADADDIAEAIRHGLTDIGENKVQVAQDKFPALGELLPGIRTHMIGHLQTNKVKAVLELFDMIQSVDSLRLAQEIDKQARHRGRKADVLIQVDCAGEDQKFGVPAEEALGLMEQVAALDYVRINGVMTIAPFVEDEAVIRSCFSAARDIRDQAARRFAHAPQISMKYLSMGMTHDYAAAIQEGANMLRIGTAIFG